jgi:dTMP kinase
MKTSEKGKGALIVIEGTDGSGKATQAELLVEKLNSAGHRAVLKAFPQYGYYASAFVERYLKGEYGSIAEVGPYQASLFYALDRYAAHFKMQEWIESGTTIVCDRYTSSNIGHQGAKFDSESDRDKFWRWLCELEFEVLKIPVPDMVVLLKVPAHIGQRMTESTKMERDIHDKDRQHLEAASQSYLSAADKFGWKTIDCYPKGEMLSRREISAEIFDEVRKLLD